MHSIGFRKGSVLSSVDFMLVVVISKTIARFFAPIPRSAFMPFIQNYRIKKEKQWLKDNKGKVWNKADHIGRPSFGTSKHDEHGFPLHSLLLHPFDLHLTNPISQTVKHAFRQHFGLELDAHDFGTADTMAIKIYTHMLEILIADHLKK